MCLETNKLKIHPIGMTALKNISNIKMYKKLVKYGGPKRECQNALFPKRRKKQYLFNRAKI